MFTGLKIKKRRKESTTRLHHWVLTTKWEWGKKEGRCGFSLITKIIRILFTESIASEKEQTWWVERFGFAHG